MSNPESPIFHPTFAAPGDQQTDLLSKASTITTFLADIAQNLVPMNGYLGLSESGGEGLRWILQALGNTIDEALGSAMDQEHTQAKKEAHA
jgi:hypothetical protein